MSDLALFYFTGTGNTASIIDLFKKEFESHGYKVNSFAIDRNFIKTFDFSIAHYDLLGLGYPVHAFNAPKIVFDFINLLPNGKNIRTFTFKCPGDPLSQAGSTHLVRNALTKKSYNVFHESLIVGPSNVVIRFDDRLTRQLYIAAQRKIKVRVEEIINNTARLQRNTWLLKVFTKLFSIGETWGAPQFGKQIKISATCNKCLKCTRICPEQNISIFKGTLQFGNQCVFCMRCIYSCPEGSIIPGFSRFIKIKNWDSFENIGKNESILPNFVTSKTKGYYKHYQKYFENI